MKDENLEKVYYLLREAFLEIRGYAAESKTQPIRKICDLLHNVPPMLIRATKDGNFEKVLAEIEHRSRTLKCDQWVQSVLKNYYVKQMQKQNEIVESEKKDITQQDSGGPQQGLIEL
jgi:hypothetical protein